jgi:two-component system, OmpR family, flagellar system response regulator FtcR
VNHCNLYCREFFCGGGFMFVILDDRFVVANGYVSCFEREGIAAIGINVGEFSEWLDTVSDEDINAVEGFLIGSSSDRRLAPERIRARSRAPLIGIIDGKALHEVLEFFACGVDDVVAKPFHVREILARIGAINRRLKHADDLVEVAGIRVFMDGRDPIVGGTTLTLPRRERRILEYLVASRNMRVTKTQIFNRVYGIFNEDIQENVIESHISRLRKRLRERLDHDPIDSQRYLGYRLIDCHREENFYGLSAGESSPMQALGDPLCSSEESGEENGNGTLRSYDNKRVGYVCSS